MLRSIVSLHKTAYRALDIEFGDQREVLLDNSLPQYK